MHHDKNKTGPYTTAYAEGWDHIFGKKDEKMGPDTPVQDPNENILPADCGHSGILKLKPARPRKHRHRREDERYHGSSTIHENNDSDVGC